MRGAVNLPNPTRRLSTSLYSEQPNGPGSRFTLGQSATSRSAGLQASRFGLTITLIRRALSEFSENVRLPFQRQCPLSLSVLSLPPAHVAPGMIERWRRRVGLAHAGVGVPLLLPQGIE